MSEQKFPLGCDEKRVREVLAHYEDQTEDEQFAEIEAVREVEGITLMAMPTELAPEVRATRPQAKRLTGRTATVGP